MSRDRNELRMACQSDPKGPSRSANVTGDTQATWRPPCSRRSFAASAVGVLMLSGPLVALAGCGASAATAPETTETPESNVSYRVTGGQVEVTLSRSPALARDGAVILADAGVLLIRAGDRLRAFSNSCTHAGCGIREVLESRVRCRCHGSEFAFDGRVLQGPATEPLPELLLTRDGDVVRIRLS